MVMPAIPQIQLQTVPAYGPAPLTVGFFVSSLNPDAAPIASYIWNFGDGQVSMLPADRAVSHLHKSRQLCRQRNRDRQRRPSGVIVRRRNRDPADAVAVGHPSLQSIAPM